MIKTQTNETIVTKTVEETVVEKGVFISGEHAQFLYDLLGNHILGRSSPKRQLSSDIFNSLSKLQSDGDIGPSRKLHLKNNEYSSSTLYILNEKGE